MRVFQSPVRARLPSPRSKSLVTSAASPPPISSQHTELQRADSESIEHQLRAALERAQVGLAVDGVGGLSPRRFNPSTCIHLGGDLRTVLHTPCDAIASLYHSISSRCASACEPRTWRCAAPWAWCPAWSAPRWCRTLRVTSLFLFYFLFRKVWRRRTDFLSTDYI